MGHYQAETPKRHWGAGNTPIIRKLDKGVLQGWKKSSKTTPVVKYVDGKGKQRYKGTSDLRKTENLDWIYFQWFHYVFELNIQEDPLDIVICYYFLEACVA